RLAEGMIGERPIGGDMAVHDLGQWIGDRHVDPLEAGHDRALRDAERRRHDPEANIATALGGGLVEIAPEAAEGPLAATRSLLENARIGIGESAARTPHRGVAARLPEPLAELAPDRDLNLEQIGSGLDRAACLAQGTREIGLADRRADPGLMRLAEEIDELRSRRSVRVDAFDGSGDQATRLLPRDRPPVGLAAQRRPRAEADRA